MCQNSKPSCGTLDGETFVLSFDSEVVFILKSQTNLEDTFKRLVSTGSQYWSGGEGVARICMSNEFPGDDMLAQEQLL